MIFGGKGSTGKGERGKGDVERMREGETVLRVERDEAGIEDKGR